MELIVSNKLSTTGLNELFAQYEIDKWDIEKYSKFATLNSGVFQYFLKGSKTSVYTAKDIFESEPAIKALDSDYWTKVINCTDVLQCMPAEKRNEWNEMIEKLKTPTFAVDTVRNTIEKLLLSRESFLAEKADGVFKRLSGKHVTNSPSGFKKRMIMDWIFSVHSGGWRSVNHDRCEYISDLRTICSQVLNKDVTHMTSMYAIINDMEKAGEFGKWVEFDGGAFKLKLFKKGTAHIEVHSEVAGKLNRLLHLLHPMAIPSEFREVKTKAKEHTLITKTIAHEELRKLDALLHRYGPSENLISAYPLDEYGSLESREILYKIGGYWEAGIKFDYDARSVISQVIRTGVIPDIKSHQYYPTPKEVVDKVHELADVKIGDSVLEPSAGQGSLLKSLPTDQIDCVEISDLNCKILEAKEYSVECKDFLKFKTDFRYDHIIMNPPFSDGRALAHLKHALSFLDDDGTLVAILPSTLMDTNIKGFTSEYEMLEPFSFEKSGTKVNTCIVKITKE